MGKLDGKVAFITGAARGQGRSHAVRLAVEGADIIAVDICQQINSVSYPLATPEDLAVTVKEVEALGRRIVATQADVRDRDQLRAALDAGLAKLGRLDVVCANAGVCPLTDETLCSSFVDALDVDLGGVQNTVAVALPHLSAGSSIIVTGSTAGMIGGLTDQMGAPGGVGYSLAKQLVARYVEVLALQLAPHSVRLNAIHPTNVNTVLLHNDNVYRAFRPDLENPTRADAELAFPVMQAMPIPYIEPEDVSALVVYLASDDSRYMTGLNLRIDAGAMLKAPPAF
ncbi:mycofactocin-coupled SDR family oxidoreductase [Pseudofrankia inefficax]|uniref:Short-chain dehydrogenase/reductase SDR n=1 Tax=Pseudofrankia inefficax (strain DSM 45817 / CECT 9037 / DDB 130130 / EuI1c) TaxID=298654 RepID=E3J3N0_PSEI1|nr:mycofactocin-coupled SDR family oxidoreductase [Pseudofrankia inefficax]ADP79367.1 short-chain dehydrogenase/reductase SDR [Pseudofrankia inefficax]